MILKQHYLTLVRSTNAQPPYIEGQSPSHCKGRPGLWPPEQPECAEVHGSWRDAPQSPGELADIIAANDIW